MTFIPAPKLPRKGDTVRLKTDLKCACGTYTEGHILTVTSNNFGERGERDLECMVDGFRHAVFGVALSYLELVIDAPR